MNSRKREVMMMGLGILTGIALAGSAGAAARQVTATLSSQPVYVDGTQASMTTYLIDGKNYVKLRDIGKAVRFNVYWDGSAVQIESDRPYTGKVPATDTPSAPREVTEESVRAALGVLKERYPHGSGYPTPYRSTSGGPYYSGMNCAGWAMLCSDAAFGGLPWRRIDNPAWRDIRVGDLVQYDNDLGNHVVVVLDKTDELLSFTDSGTTQKVYWIGQYTRQWLEQRSSLILYTRYPQ